MASRCYIRPLAEMDGYWNCYCAFNQNGSFRGAAHSTKNFRLAFRRIYTILHGGAVSTMNARFHNWGVRRLQSSKTSPRPLPQVEGLLEPAGLREPGHSCEQCEGLLPRGQVRRRRRRRHLRQERPVRIRRDGRPSRPTRPSRTRSASSVSGAPTTRRSSARSPTSCATTSAPNWPSTTSLSRARSSISARSRAAGRHTGGT